MSDSTTLRDRASQLAPTDPGSAEATADRIEDPWYRAQALAWVTRYAADAELNRLAQKAMDAAGSCSDPCQQAGASAWIVRALLEREQRDLALQMLEIALHAVPRITSEARRSEALFLLYQAAFEASAEIRRSLLFALAELHDASDHWRVARNLRDALAMAKDLDAEFVGKLARGRDDEASHAIRRALEGEPVEPRAFFW